MMIPGKWKGREFIKVTTNNSRKSWQDPKEPWKGGKQMWGEFNKALTNDEEALRDTEDPVKGTPCRKGFLVPFWPQ